MRHSVVSRFRALPAILLVVLLLAATGCGSANPVWQAITPDQLLDLSQGEPIPAEGDTETLEIWGDADPYWLVPFTRMYPTVKVYTREQNASTWRAEWISAIASGQSADLYVWDETDMDWCVDLPILADLTDTRFDSRDVLDSLTPAEMRLATQPGGSVPTMIPQQTHPVLLFYRDDLVREAGYRMSPEALGAWLSDGDNWLALLKAMKEQGHYGIEWPNHPFLAGSINQSPFDAKYSWKFSQDRYVKAIEFAVTANREGLVSNINIWSEDGKTALNEGRLAMFLGGSWAIDQLPAWAPDTYGKWRVARQPLGMQAEWATRWYGIDRNADQPEAAWHYLRLATMTARQDQEKRRNRAHAFYGTQQVYQVALDAADNREPVSRTPFDQQAAALMNEELPLLYATTIEPGKWLEQVRQRIDATFGEDLARMRALAGRD